MEEEEALNSERRDTPLLDNIEIPFDVRQLRREDLPQLCEELRRDLVATVSKSGGHFASSLGVTEITVALHWALNTPEDRIVWDVGHQSYIHKILTARRDELPGVRKLGGISGFPSRRESTYDTFGVAHAGTSISAASGMREGLSRGSKKARERHVAVVIGDGGLTAGMAFEALNHSGQLNKNLIVILNDNEMSIAPNVGAMSWAFSKTITGKFSTKARRQFKALHEKGLVPDSFYHAIDRAEEATQGFFSAPAFLFANFGYRYMGPVDGHNVFQMLDAIERAKSQEGPVLIHALTVKGKGYAPAETDPVKWHGVGPFDAKNGTSLKASNKTAAALSYTEVFGNTMIELCRDDERVVGITAAMPDGTGLTKLAQEMPERFYDVGIAEQHAVTFAAGLACEGIRPVCAIYSTFLQRAFDQVVHDVCIQSLPVIFAMDRGGLVGADGPTHHGVFDISCLRSLPNMTIMAPRNEAELRDMMLTSVHHLSGPIAFRYPRGSALGVDISSPPRTIPIGKGELLESPENADVLLIGIGLTVQFCLQAAAELLQTHGIAASVVDARFVKPLDEELLSSQINSHRLIVTVEDHVIRGGFGSAVLEFMADEGLTEHRQIIRLGIEDNFVEHGTQQELYRLCQFDAESIVARVSEALGRSEEALKPMLVNA